MKYVVIIPDGAADLPLDSLGGKTALEAAALPAMDQIAKAGVVGQVNLVPTGLPVSSDVALLSLLGLDPSEFACGRASLEALARDIHLEPEQCAVRCNLVTLQDGNLVDPTAGAISSLEAAELIQFANDRMMETNLGQGELKLVAGVGYRNLLIGSGNFGVTLTSDSRMLSPNQLAGQSVQDAFPRGPASETLCKLMELSVDWFAQHPVNQKRREQGLPTATCFWFWGPGRAPKRSLFSDQFGKSASMIAAVDVAHGLAKMRGIARVTIPTATGMPDTDYRAKGAAACNEIDNTDVIFVHIEAPDEAAHQRNAALKVETLEAIDREIVQPVVARLQQEDEWRILLCPDHLTCCSDGKHHSGMVCFAAAGTGISADDFDRLDETTAAQSSLMFKDGTKLLPWLFGY